MEDWKSQVDRGAEIHKVEGDPRPLHQQFFGLHPDDEDYVRELVHKRGFSYTDAVERAKGKRQMDKIRAEKGPVLGDNWFGRSRIGRLVDRIRDKILLLDMYDD